MTNYKPATALPSGRITLAVFDAAPNPQNAVALARADHRAGQMTDWKFMDALSKAEERCVAYPRLVEALRGVELLARVNAPINNDSPTQ